MFDDNFPFVCRDARRPAGADGRRAIQIKIDVARSCDRHPLDAVNFAGLADHAIDWAGDLEALPGDGTNARFQRAGEKLIEAGVAEGIRLRSLGSESSHASLEVLRELFALSDDPDSEDPQQGESSLAQVHDLRRRRER